MTSLDMMSDKDWLAMTEAERDAAVKKELDVIVWTCDMTQWQKPYQTGATNGKIRLKHRCLRREYMT